MTHDAFRLTLPSDAEHLGTARSFAAAVARHYEIVGEAVEDLKVAISEACVDALSLGEPIHLAAEETGRAVSFIVDAPESADGATGPAAVEELDAPGRIELIRSLFPDTAVEIADGRRVIRFSLSFD